MYTLFSVPMEGYFGTILQLSLIFPPCFSAQPLPELPSLRERRAYQPVVIQQHLSLWDSLHFTDKVSCRNTESDKIPGSKIINIICVALLRTELQGCLQTTVIFKILNT